MCDRVMLDWRWKLEALLETWREMVAACFGLFAHNLRGAGFAIAAMIGMAVAAARLAASTWLVVLGLGVHLAVKNGLNREAGGLLVLVVNLGIRRADHGRAPHR